MKRVFLPLLTSLVLLPGCATNPAFHSVIGKDTNATSSKTVQGITGLANDVRPIKLIIVHGAGDHCPGYAIGGHGNTSHNWLSDDMMRKINLRPTGPITSFGFNAFNVSDISNNQFDMYLTSRSFLLEASNNRKIPVEATEITWSLLTQRIKSEALAFDSTVPITTSARTNIDCTNPPTLTDNNIVPPHRALTNRIVKEHQINRGLADVILYKGRYGEVIRRAFADALCYTLSSSKDKQCSWRNNDNSYRYVFIAQGVGAEIVYDTLLELSGIRKSEGTDIFDPEYVNSSRSAATTIIENTMAVYMAGTQFAFSGLTDIAPFKELRSHSDNKKIDQVGKVIEVDANVCLTQIATFGNVKLRLSAEGTFKPNKLEIVNFTDSNDLFSWHVPNNYLSTNSCITNMTLTNVFVKNSTVWAGLVECPPDAEALYFKNEKVLKTIFCGAVDGRVSECTEVKPLH